MKKAKKNYEMLEKNEKYLRKVRRKQEFFYKMCIKCDEKFAY